MFLPSDEPKNSLLRPCPAGVGDLDLTGDSPATGSREASKLSEKRLAGSVGHCILCVSHFVYCISYMIR